MWVNQLFFVLVFISHIIRPNVIGFAVGKYQSCRNIISMSVTKINAFNPFTSRTKNSHIKWFEADLTAFYTFVDTQPLLTAEEEFAYGKAIQMSSRMENIKSKSVTDGSINAYITDEELATYLGVSLETLGKIAPYGEFAKNRMINSNLKLVLAIVSRYRTSGIPNVELIAEGVRGLSKAVLRYDYTKGFRFATYATWYVHQGVADYARWKRHPAKMPSRYLILQRKIKAFTIEFNSINGRPPSTKELCVSLKQKEYDITKVLSMNIYPTLSSASMGSSINGNERTFEEVMPSRFKAPLEMENGRDLRLDMENLMRVNLSDVERDILRLRLGLDDGAVKAVKEVGRKFKIPWEQVRSVEKEAISKLLHCEEIHDFVENYYSV